MNIDARKHHDPAKAPELVEKAIERVGSQKEVAERCDVSSEYLRLLAQGQREMSYVMQVALECLVETSQT